MKLFAKETDRGTFVFQKGLGTGPRQKHINTAIADIGAETTYSVGGESVDIFSWGTKNDLPQRREALVRSNNIVGELIKTKRDITVGRGLIAYRLEYVDGKRKLEEVEIPKEAQEFFDRNSIYHYLLSSCQNLYMHGQFFPEFVRNIKREKIVSMRNMDCKHVRLGQQNDDGRVEYIYFNKNWIVKRGSHKRKPSDEIPTYFPLYDAKVPQEDKFAMQIGEELISDDYYYHPMWWGGRDWIETANSVPRFHNANFRNGYTIRWHVQYPSDYFKHRTSADMTKQAIRKAKETERERKSDFISRMNELLAGVENTGRAVYTSYELNKTIAKEYPGVKITPLSADLKDEALLKLFEKSNQANISAQGIHPTLANIETQGKLSSGSEIKNALNMYLNIKVPVPRKLLLEPINLVKKINGWPQDIHFGFRDMEITNLDENPTGRQSITSE